MMTGGDDQSLKRQALELGATDLLRKPVDPDELVVRLKNVLRLKAYQDCLLSRNGALERAVAERTRALEQSRRELIWRLGKAAECRDGDTGYHVLRVSQYCRSSRRGLGLMMRGSSCSR
jgi:putative two-component system response regulator